AGPGHARRGAEDDEAERLERVGAEPVVRPHARERLRRDLLRDHGRPPRVRERRRRAGAEGDREQDREGRSRRERPGEERPAEEREEVREEQASRPPAKRDQRSEDEPEAERAGDEAEPRRRPEMLARERRP